MQATQKLKDYIKNEEGFRARAYLDPPKNTRGLYSIGYGHQIQPNEKALLSRTLTVPEANLMFDVDFRQYEAAVNSNLKKPVSQDQFDALCDFAYNCGTGAVAKVISTWNATGSVTDTVAHIKQYDKVHISATVVKADPNLTARRNDEANLFLSVADFTQKKNG